MYGQVNPINTNINSNIENLSVGMPPSDDKFDQFLEFTEFQNVYDSIEGGNVLEEGEMERMSDQIL